MGLFVYLRGEFECVRCRRASDAWIQTKLLRTEADNAGRDYRVGDTEIMDGLCDYCPLHPWDGCSRLTVAVGDWDCKHCGLAWQWAKAVLDVRHATEQLVATIRELSGFQPWRTEDLAGVHFMESDLAELSGLWEPPPRYNWPEGFEHWQACPVPQRCERVATGFRAWCREVTGVDQEAEPGATADGGA